MARVLIVEDDRPLRHLMDAVLRTAGHETMLAEDATQALEHLASGQEIILLDLGLPGLDGATFLAEAIHRGYKGKVLVVSGLDDGSSIAHMMGAEGFLAKPFTPDQLENAVEDTLRLRQAS